MCQSLYVINDHGFISCHLKQRALYLQTEYLYRVIASGEGGWTAGPWQRGRSRETGRTV